jgi:hypothetical protein
VQHFEENRIRAERNAMDWMINAYRYGKGGFPHSRWMYLPDVIAWQKDYAETSGYFIENLLDWNSDSHKDTQKIALNTGKWLLKIQAPEGYYHSGIQFVKASAFNTGQVLFGLDQLYSHTGDKAYLNALKKAFEYLANGIHNDGSMYRGLYVNSYYATYYSRMLWPMIMIDLKYFKSLHAGRLVQSVMHLFNKKNNSGFFDDSGFYKNKASLLHTVIYTLEGFYECSKFLKASEINRYVLNILDELCLWFDKTNKTPGYISANFTPDYSFICVSGQAQLCALLLKVYRDENKNHYKDIAIQLFNQLCSWQNQTGHRGALPSSIPVWRPYFPFRYTHWTMKFFLDACAFLKNSHINLH